MSVGGKSNHTGIQQMRTKKKNENSHLWRFIGSSDYIKWDARFNYLFISEYPKTLELSRT